MHEIITIQCGPSANYLATHFWNIQEHLIRKSDEDDPLNHDALFSSGIAPDGSVTYTPRALLYDRGRNFGAMRKVNALYQPPPSQTEDEQRYETLHQDPLRTHPFQTSLDSDPDGDASLLSGPSVLAWSDYSTQFFRPASYLPVDPTSAADLLFDEYEHGETSFKARDSELEILDHDLRPFVEECDLMQGFQIMAELTTGWSGFAARQVQLLADEFPKSSKWLLSTGVPSHGIGRKAVHNLARAVMAMQEDVSCILPFQTPAQYVASADAAVWWHEISLPSRQKEEVLKMSDVLSFLLPGRCIKSARRGTVRGRSDATLTQVVHGPAERTFRVERGDKWGLQSQLDDAGRLLTSYSYAEQRLLLPPCVPVREDWHDETDVSLDDCSSGAKAFLAHLRTDVAAIRGAVGYAERKELLAEMAEYEQAYRNEFDIDSELEDAGSSDDD